MGAQTVRDQPGGFHRRQLGADARRAIDVSERSSEQEPVPTRAGRLRNWVRSSTARTPETSNSLHAMHAAKPSVGSRYFPPVLRECRGGFVRRPGTTAPFLSRAQQPTAAPSK